MQQKYFLPRIWVRQGAAILVRSLPVKSGESDTHYCHRRQPFSGRHIHKMPDTKMVAMTAVFSRLSNVDFKQTKTSIDRKTAMSLFIFKFPSCRQRPVIVCLFVFSFAVPCKHFLLKCPEGGDVAQLVEHLTGTLPTQVRFPGGRQDMFLPESTFSADSLACVRTPSMCNRTHLHLCAR